MLFHSDGKPMKKASKPAPLRGAPVSLAPQDGQHLLVGPNKTCDSCEKLPKKSTLIHLGGRLLCVRCYRREQVAAEVARQEGGG